MDFDRLAALTKFWDEKVPPMHGLLARLAAYKGAWKPPTSRMGRRKPPKDAQGREMGMVPETAGDSMLLAMMMSQPSGSI